ncbi:MAG: PilZ domain-containing protein [Sphingomonadaceae bacterium]
MRRPVMMAAQCRTQSGLRDRGEISDISETGCCLRAQSLFFRVGARIVIKPEGIEGLVGIVRWISNECAGIEFETPIYGPVLDHLCAQNAAGASVGLRAY